METLATLYVLDRRNSDQIVGYAVGDFEWLELLADTAQEIIDRDDYGVWEQAHMFFDDETGFSAKMILRRIVAYEKMGVHVHNVARIAEKGYHQWLAEVLNRQGSTEPGIKYIDETTDELMALLEGFDYYYWVAAEDEIFSRTCVHCKQGIFQESYGEWIALADQGGCDHEPEPVNP